MTSFGSTWISLCKSLLHYLCVGWFINLLNRVMSLEHSIALHARFKLSKLIWGAVIYIRLFCGYKGILQLVFYVISNWSHFKQAQRPRVDCPMQLIYIRSIFRGTEVKYRGCDMGLSQPISCPIVYWPQLQIHLTSQHIIINIKCATNLGKNVSYDERLELK